VVEYWKKGGNIMKKVLLILLTMGLVFGVAINETYAYDTVYPYPVENEDGTLNLTGWIGYDTDDEATLLKYIASGDVIYYMGQYWCSPRIVEAFSNGEDISERMFGTTTSTQPQTLTPTIGLNSSTPAATQEMQNRNIAVFVNGAQLEMDVKPIIQDGRTLVPLRAIMEALDVEVLWSEKTQSIFYFNSDCISYDLTIGSKEVKVGAAAGVEPIIAVLDVAPVIIDGRTFVPVRFIAESLGVKVDYNADARIVYVGSLPAKTQSINTVDDNSVLDSSIALELATRDFYETTYQNLSPSVSIGISDNNSNDIAEEERLKIEDDRWYSSGELGLFNVVADVSDVKIGWDTSKIQEDIGGKATYVFEGNIQFRSPDGSIIFEINANESFKHEDEVEFAINGLRVKIKPDNQYGKIYFYGQNLRELGIVK